MRHWLRSHLTYANVMATIAVFLALSGGTAVALQGSNTVFSDDIVNNEVRSADVRDDTLASGGLKAVDLRPGAVGTSEVADNALTGDNIDESSLGEVPSATLGGLGRNAGFDSCNPESAAFTSCAFTTATLPGSARVLIIGQIRAEPDTGGGNGGGSCRVGSDLGFVGVSTTPVFVNGGKPM